MQGSSYSARSGSGACGGPGERPAKVPPFRGDGPRASGCRSGSSLVLQLERSTGLTLSLPFARAHRGTERMRTMASQERDRAGQRLEAALVEQDRLRERFDAAVGTSTEFGAYVRLRAAGDQVKA